MIHELKTWPPFYEALIRNKKKFEMRAADRPFAVGDVLELREFDPAAKTYTGRRLRREITYIIVGPAFGVAEGFCALSIT